jgi:type III secretion protein U
VSGEKTEQPTPKRLREAREKGDIPKSQDIAPALTVLALTIYLIAKGEDIFTRLQEMGKVVFSTIGLPFDQALGMALAGVGNAALDIVAPIIAVVMGAALVGTLGQVGVLIAFKAAIPKMDNISPSKWFKKVFSIKNGVDFLKNILKVTILGLTAWMVLRAHLRELFLIPGGDIRLLWSTLGSAAKDLTLNVAGIFCVIAMLDYLFQRWQYSKQHMMSKDEVKREYKEMEGDPHIKGKRKQLHQEMISQNALGNVRKAKVLVTNPTHYAVALDYEKDKTPLPVIVAKGEGLLARRMIGVAKEEGIPIMQNVPLARDLFRNGTENSYIPQDLIGPVAEVLRWVQSLRRD